jgi:hypothetical protein
VFDICQVKERGVADPLEGREEQLPQQHVLGSVAGPSTLLDSRPACHVLQAVARERPGQYQELVTGG